MISTVPCLAADRTGLIREAPAALAPHTGPIAGAAGSGDDYEVVDVAALCGDPVGRLNGHQPNRFRGTAFGLAFVTLKEADRSAPSVAAAMARLLPAPKGSFRQ